VTHPAARVLIVDDDPAMRSILARILADHEYECATVGSAAEARTALEESAWGVVLCDVNMPGESGLSLVRHIRETSPHTAVVMVSGVDDPFVATTALDLGAYGYLTKPFLSNQVLIAVANATRRSRLEEENSAYREHLEAMVVERTADLSRSQGALHSAEDALRESSEEMIALLLKFIEGRDVETGRHIERMSRYAALLARRTGMPEARCELIRLASAMHDVGKISVPDGILLKPGRLTPAEYEVVKQHAEFGFRMMSRSNQPLVALAATIAYTHHERWDGGGYPQGLAGEDIPFEGRIAALADVFDALMSRRVYKSEFPLEQTVDIMRAGRGTQFDPALTDLLLEDVAELAGIRAAYPDDAGEYVR
jgi:putative two-component system response regulator